MKIGVRLFAMLRELAGVERLELPVPPGSTVRGLVGALGAARPALAAPLGERRILVVVNERYADLDTPLREGDEVALLPPVSGG